MFCVGIGQDSHAFLKEKSEKKLILGGVEIPNHIGLQGNSDADVIAHAIFNTLSSAIGERSIGIYADELCIEKQIYDSFVYLKLIKKKIDKKYLSINNLSVSVEAKTPRLEMYHDRMKKNICDFFKLAIDQVGITFTSGENLSSFGRGEGIQVFCVASLLKKNN